MPDRHICLFPDTNTLLHYPQLKDVDWRAVSQADAVTIVLCLPVIQELDAKKNDARLRARAERAIREIRQLLSVSGAVRQGVTLEVFNEAIRSSDFNESLSPDSGDDRIVRCVQKYSEKKEIVKAAVYSEDLGMALRCSLHGIPVIEPDKASRLEDPHSELERKYKAVVIENQGLKSQLPEIHVVIRTTDSDSDSSVVEFRLSRSDVDALDVETEVEKERRRLALPPKPGSPPPRPMKGQGISLSELAQSHQPFTEEQRQQYQEALESYLTEYARWLIDDHAAKSALERIIGFEVEIGNDGKAVGEEVDVYLEFPPAFEYLSGEDKSVGSLPKRPNRPDPPKRPWVSATSSLQNLLRSGAFRPTYGPPASLYPHGFTIPKIHTVRDPWCSIKNNAEEGVTLRIFMPRLNHHHHRVFGPFSGILKPWAVAKPFEVKIDIMSASHPDKSESRSVFKFVVDHKEDPGD